MPGLDQRGPDGMGSMTGRRQGVCKGRGTANGRRGFRGNGRSCRCYDTEAELKDRARILEDELKTVKD